MDCKKFIEEQISEIVKAVGSGSAINALSGGVDNHRAGHASVKSLQSYHQDIV